MKRNRHGRRRHRKGPKTGKPAPSLARDLEDRAALQDLQAPPVEPPTEEAAKALLSEEAHAAKRHWAHHLRPLYVDLVQRKRLNRALYRAQELTSKAVAHLRLGGVPASEALRRVAKEWLFPPNEAVDRLNHELANLDESEVLARVSELAAPSDLAVS